NLRDGHYTLRGRSGPRVFSQTNDGVANALRDLIIELIPPNQELLIDAFCGAGFFAKTLVDKFQRIIGIDWDRFAIAAAQENASEKETYIAGDVAAELRRVLEQISDVEAAVPAAGVGQRAGDTPATTLIVDPPAIGLSAQIRQSLV